MKIFSSVNNTYHIAVKELHKKNKVFPQMLPTSEAVEYEYTAFRLNDLAEIINNTPRLLRPFLMFKYSEHARLEHEFTNLIRFWAFGAKDKRMGRLAAIPGNS